MFLEVIFRDDTIEFSTERAAILPNGVTFSLALEVENAEEAKKQIEGLLPQLDKHRNALVKELAKIGKLISSATRVPNAEDVEVEIASSRRSRSR